jgi:hypothetical protein
MPGTVEVTLPKMLQLALRVMHLCCAHAAQHFFAIPPEFRGLWRLQALLRCAMLRAYRQERPLHG